MPGLTLYLTTSPDQAAQKQRFAAAQSTMQQGRDERATIGVAENGLYLGHVNYPEYPVSIFQRNGRRIYFEGRIYNKSRLAIENEMHDLAEAVLEHPENAAARITPWMFASEGEYIIAMMDTVRRAIVLFTDPFTRLPLYHYSSETELIISRECKFIQALKPRPAYDPVGWAEMLLFRYTLGRRTIYKDIKNAPGAAMIIGRADGDTVRTSVTALYTTDFTEKDESPRTTRQCAAQQLERWDAMCGAWCNNMGEGPRVISLSGGRDSRIVAAVMARHKIPCVSATFVDAYGVFERDAQVAREIAAALDIPWQRFDLQHIGREYQEALVRLSDGINPVANATMLPYLEQIVAKWGRAANYITGDGGDFVFPDLRPPRPIESMDVLIRECIGIIIDATPVADAEAMLNLEPGTIRQELRDLLESYPEKDFTQKAIHFRRYERGQNWIFKGEDRTRHFLWECSPYYLFSIFQHAMRIPDRLKSYDALYREFLELISPEWAALAEVGMGMRLNSPLRPLKYRIKKKAIRLPPWIKEPVRYLLKGPRPSFTPAAENLNLLRERLRIPDALGAILSPEAVERRLPKMNRLEFENFWTLVLLEQVNNPFPGRS